MQSLLIVSAMLVSSVVVLPLQGSLAEEVRSTGSSPARPAHAPEHDGALRTDHFADEEEMISSPCLRASFAELLLGAHPDVEVAAFVVADEEGQMSCLIWPRMSWIRSQTFHGTIPQGTVAVVHTHPPREERPSNGDTLESVRLRLPFYVLTEAAIWVVDPATGKSFRTGAGPEWSRKAAPAVACNRPRPLR